MDIFDNGAANAGFGCVALGAIGMVVVVAGFKYRWLRSKMTLFLVAVSVLLVTVNSGGILGEIAGALRLGMNAAGEAAVTGVSGTTPAADPPTTSIAPLSAGGAVVGLGGIAWYAVKLYAAKGRIREMPELCVGAGVGICFGTGLGFMGYFVAGAVLTANNIGYWLIGG